MIVTTDCYGRDVLREMTTAGQYLYTVRQEGATVLQLTRDISVPLSAVVRTIEGMKTGSDPIEVRRAALCERVNAMRDERVSGPILHNGVLYDADPASRARLTGMIAICGNIPELPQGFVWRSYDNSDIPVDKAGLVGLSLGFMAFDYACFQASWALKAQILASDNPESVDLTAGWP
jgi:hypothetical protein